MLLWLLLSFEQSDWSNVKIIDIVLYSQYNSTVVKISFIRTKLQFLGIYAGKHYSMITERKVNTLPRLVCIVCARYINGNTWCVLWVLCGGVMVKEGER